MNFFKSRGRGRFKVEKTVFKIFFVKVSLPFQKLFSCLKYSRNLNYLHASLIRYEGPEPRVSAVTIPEEDIDHFSSEPALLEPIRRRSFFFRSLFPPSIFA